MAGKVQAIDRRSVHQICSGQVVLNLATAVKELVENSLDAGATSVEIRLKNHGAELLEVIDNGSGVKEHNFQALTLKHHTSKLNDFSDLAGVSTFGFRGEALSSLCALSNLTIITCYTSVAIGTKLEYDHDGKLVKQTPCSRQPGTTVSLQNVFSTFPVRHKEFLRNIKKEFSKMVHLLQAYCLISTGVRITCSNQVGTGKKIVVAQTQRNSSIRDNLSNIYGPKVLHNLLDLKQNEPSLDCCEEFGLAQNSQQNNVFSISGYISSCDHGSGRSSADRQYYFINSRPCDFPKVSKLVNEVYHMYNRHQYPTVVLNITLAKDYVDVNLTPDKRKILVQEERTLLAIIKTSLVKLYEPLSATYQVKHSSLPSKLLPNMFQRNGSQDSPEITNSKDQPMSQFTKVTLSNLKRSFSHTDVEKNKESPERKPFKCPRIDDFLSRVSSQTDSKSFQDRLNDTSKTSEVQSWSGVNDVDLNPREKDLFSDRSDTKKELESPVQHELGEGCLSSLTEKRSAFDIDSTLEPQMLTDDTENTHEDHETPSCDETTPDPQQQADRDIQKVHSFPVGDDRNSDTDTNKDFTQVDEACAVIRKQVTIPFSMKGLQNNDDKVTSKGSDGNSRCFRASITTSDNSAAESELVRHISKDMFSKMHVLGQFNLGFIIAKLKSDLFIIDQHASDEKYNFETFQRTTTLQSQKLIRPQKLELTAVNESILMDNIEIFRQNGFDFQIDDEELPTQRVKLVSLPVSKNWTFGADDINEMIFMLMDAPGTLCRPSRVRQMFASRACRKSVMIGTALNYSDMKKLVFNMGEIDQPWNCPHGRPTMRHLINLQMLPD